MSTTPKPTVREMTADDWSAVEDLRARCGLLPRRSFAEWEHLWGRNPSAQIGGVRLSMGWVLEDAGKVVGGMGNIGLVFHQGGRLLTVAVPNSLAVDPAYRGYTLQLVMPYLKQQGVDVLLITTAGPATIALFVKALKFSAMPYRAHYESLFWVLDARAFSRSILLHLKLPAPLRAVGNVVLPALVRVEAMFRGSHRPEPSKAFTTRVIAAEDIGKDFDELWQRKIATDPRFMELRTADLLRWRFGDPAVGGRFKIVCCDRNGELAGYSIIGYSAHATGLVKATLCDLFAEGDEGPVIDALLATSRTQAARDGAGVLEVLGLPGSVRARLAAFKPLTRKVVADGSEPCLYKVGKTLTPPGLLDDASAWYTRANDGDVGL